MRVKATIHVRGNPLRQVYVEHIVGGIGQGMYMTNVNGEIRDVDFNEGIDSITDNADIRIICQNPILRVLNGDAANIGVYQDKAIVEGATVNLNTNADQAVYFAILNRTQVTYEMVFQPLSFFQNLSEPEFPLGLQASLRDTRDQAKRVDLIYPDHSVAPRAWVEPKRLGDDFPLMHIKARTDDGRRPLEVSELPIFHELAHAIHFSFLTKAQRTRAQDKYLEFILSSPIRGVEPTHNFGVRTTAEVAYIEAAGFFSENFMESLRRDGAIRAQAITAAIQARFVESEWVRLTTYSQVVAMIPFRNGVITAFSGKGIYRSPDGQNLGGGGATTQVYTGSQTVEFMIPFRNDAVALPRDEVITAFSGKGIYRSPDGQNLGGGGATTQVYTGNQTVTAMIPFRNGVITAFSGKGIYHSPDGQNLGGGGATTQVYTGNQTVTAMIPFRNGVITAFSGKGIYHSPDGQNLGGGGATTQVYTGNQTVTAMIPFRNGVITAFSGKGIYHSPDGQNLGGGGATTQVYTGNQTVTAMIPFRNGVITAFSGKNIYFSPDGQLLGDTAVRDPSSGVRTRRVPTTAVPAVGVPRDALQPTVTGGDVEGAVYAAIFVDFASLVGLDFAASSYFEANAINFGQYRSFVKDQHPEHFETLEQVRRFWRL